MSLYRSGWHAAHCIDQDGFKHRKNPLTSALNAGINAALPCLAYSVSFRHTFLKAGHRQDAARIIAGAYHEHAVQSLVEVQNLLACCWQSAPRAQASHSIPTLLQTLPSLLFCHYGRKQDRDSTVLLLSLESHG